MSAVRKYSRQIALIVMIVFVVGCAGSGALPPPEPAPGEREFYVIGIPDVLKIVVWRNPDLSVEVPVRRDGKISVPLVDDVQAEGLTPEELKEVLTEALADFMKVIELDKSPPGQAEAWKQIGLIHHQTNHPDDALAAYNQSLAANNSDANTHRLRAETLLALNLEQDPDQYQEAIDAFSLYLKLGETRLLTCFALVHWLSRNLADFANRWQT